MSVYVYMYIYMYKNTPTVSFLPKICGRERGQGISVPRLNICRPPLGRPSIFKHRTVTLCARHQVCIDLLGRFDNRKEFQVCSRCVTS